MNKKAKANSQHQTKEKNSTRLLTGWIKGADSRSAAALSLACSFSLFQCASGVRAAGAARLRGQGRSLALVVARQRDARTAGERRVQETDSHRAGRQTGGGITLAPPASPSCSRQSLTPALVPPEPSAPRQYTWSASGIRGETRFCRGGVGTQLAGSAKEEERWGRQGSDCG